MCACINGDIGQWKNNNSYGACTSNNFHSRRAAVKSKQQATKTKQIRRKLAAQANIQLRAPLYA